MKVWASEVNVSVANLPGSLEYLVVISAFFFFLNHFFVCVIQVYGHSLFLTLHGV